MFLERDVPRCTHILYPSSDPPTTPTNLVQLAAHSSECHKFAILLYLEESQNRERKIEIYFELNCHLSDGKVMVFLLPTYWTPLSNLSSPALILLTALNRLSPLPLTKTITGLRVSSNRFLSCTYFCLSKDYPIIYLSISFPHLLSTSNANSFRQQFVFISVLETTRLCRKLNKK
jgi:hypothetical protein